MEEVYRAAKLIHEEATNELLILRFEHREGAHEGREHATPVDVTNEQCGHVCCAGKPHIDDVATAQVDLGGATGTFANDDVKASPEGAIRLNDHLEQIMFGVPAGGGIEVAAGTSEHDELTLPIGTGFEQYGVHDDLGLHSRRLSLDDLSSPYLPSVVRDEGVERHVLSLEGSDRCTPAEKPST